ncbi:MAG: NAD-dependent protein deacetylase [Gammaproteobacteria bacterium]|nr:NAD-dependent protein deacetylase [Gammaproteobacteria bacterium]
MTLDHSKRVSHSDLSSLVRFVREHRPLCVISGAGCSTNSGIFDYRDDEGNWKRPQPVLLDEFLSSVNSRRRYWARSMLGWPLFAKATPNTAHLALKRLEDLGLVGSVITQNVDDLHESSGQKNVIALHGSLRTVTCLNCQTCFSREEIQKRLEATNPLYVSTAVMPDAGGEGYYSINIDESFVVPVCDTCGGVLKPDVVFFGGNINANVKQAANDAIHKARGVLVVGSSLMVYSSFRLVKLARARGTPIAILGHGVTRGDALATLTIRCEITSTFEELLKCLKV